MADRTLSDQHGLPNIFQQEYPDALQAWASQLVSNSQAENVIHALKPMVTSVAFLTPNAARVQAQLSHKSALGSKKILAGWRKFLSPHPKPFTCVGWGFDFFRWSNQLPLRGKQLAVDLDRWTLFFGLL
jgi:hypothetical protein